MSDPTPFHSQLQPIPDGIHGIVGLVYADAAARSSAVGLTALDVNKIAEQIDDKSLWRLKSTGPSVWERLHSGSSSIDWADVQGKPTEFPPETHDHNTLYYTKSEITAYLAGKSNTGHTHDAAGIVSGQLDIARIPTGTSSSTACIGNDVRLSDARTPTAHNHDAAEVITGTLDKDRLPVMIAAGPSADGEKGIVPRPVSGDHVKFLRGDATWQAVAGAAVLITDAATGVVIAVPTGGGATQTLLVNGQSSQAGIKITHTGGSGIGLHSISSAGGTAGRFSQTGVTANNTILYVDRQAGAGGGNSTPVVSIVDASTSPGALLRLEKQSTVYFEVRSTGQMAYNFGTASAASTGAASALPGLPAGYIVVSINNTDQKIPYYNS